MRACGCQASTFVRPCRGAPAFATLRGVFSPVKRAGSRRSKDVFAPMRPVLKTNNPVLLSFAQNLLSDADIESVVFDENASVMDGSLGILPRRLMVPDDDFERAKAILTEEMTRADAARQTPVEITEDRF